MMENELPRKDAVRVLVNILYEFRNVFKPNYAGQHREVANRIIDKIETISNLSKYKVRFTIDNNTISALVKHVPVATIDVNEFREFCTQNLENVVNCYNEKIQQFQWNVLIEKFDWVQV